MRYIGIDFGSKKVGIAQSDDEGRMAFPDRVVPNDGQLFAIVRDLALSTKATVVLGDSRDFAGNENPIAIKIRAFGEELGKEGIVVVYEPEWFTSREAERIQGRTKDTDASAAALILNGYLTRINNQQRS